MLPAIWHGTLREHYLVLFGAAGLIAMVSGTIAAWIGARAGARRAARETRQHVLAALDATDASMRRRLDLLQGSIETMAVEVERVSEAQRFSARLLADRAFRQDPPSHSTPRSGSRTPATPH